MSNKKWAIKEIKDVKIYNAKTGEEIDTNNTPIEDDGIIKGNFKYSKDSIMKAKQEFDFSKAPMKGFYEDLVNLKSNLEDFYDKNVFYLGYLLDEAPYHGWAGDELKKMKEIDREICKRFNEIYAIILRGIGE